MACSQEMLELLSCYVDGEATPEEAARAEAHLDTCPECRETVQEWRHGIEMLDWTYARALPEDVAEPTFDPPMPAPERVQKRWTFALPDMRILAAAAVLAFIALIGSTVYQQLTALPTLGRSLATARTAQTVLVAKGIRLEVEPDSEISRLGDKAVRLVQGTINAEVTHGRGFMVLTRKLEIIDQGTRFQVHSDPGTDRVTVKEGRVLVREGKDEYHVGAGESLASTSDQHHNETKVTRNDKDNVPHTPHGGIDFGLLIVTILANFLLIYWVKMLVNVLRREGKDSGRKIDWWDMISQGIITYGLVLNVFAYYYIPSLKITWVQGFLIGQLLTTIIYYFHMHKKDHPWEQFRYMLVVRKGNQRVIQWWRVLFYAVYSSAVSSIASANVADEGNWATLLVGVTLGFTFVVACIAQEFSYPLDVLTDLETGERPDPGVTNKHYPLPNMVARMYGKRVIMWGNIIAWAGLAAYLTTANRVLKLGSLGNTNQVPPPCVVAEVFLGLVALMVIYSLLVPLNKPSKFEDDRADE